MAPSLRQRMTRTAGFFQGLVALPVMLIMGESLFEQLFDHYLYRRIYAFMLSLFNALFSAAILFIVLVQYQPIRSYSIRLYLEIAKSSLATAVWLWLLMDSIFAPIGYSYNPPPPREPRIISAALSSLVLFCLYYPTLVYAILDKSYDDAPENPEAGEAAAADEQTPLLRE